MKSPDQRTSGTINSFWARLSLQGKTLSIFLLVALIPMIGLAILGTVQTQRALTAAAESSLKGTAAQSAASLDDFINTLLDSIRVEARSPDLVDYLSLSPAVREDGPIEKRLLTYLNVLDGKDSINILSYGILDRNGLNVLDNTSEYIGVSEADSLYFREVLRSGTPYASPVINRSDGSPVIYFASPIRNSEREIVGVLRAEYNAGVIQQLVNTSAQTSVGTTIMVLDDNFIRQADTSNSDLVLHPIAPLSQENLDAAVAEKRLLVDNLSNSPAANNNDFAASLDRNSTSQFFEADLFSDVAGTDSVATARMDSQSWIVVVSQPRSLLLADVQRQTILNLIVLFVVALVVAGVASITSRTITGPLTTLTATAENIASGNLGSRAIVQTQDEIGALAGAFNKMTDQLNQLLTGLEQRVEERTAALKKRSSQLEAIAEVARSVASVQEVDKLLSEVTTLVSEGFGFYHVGIFLLDSSREFANLQAANSQGGKRMLARGHRLKVGEQGIVGFVTLRGEARIALNVGAETVYFNNPDLPETHSEVALPLRVGTMVIGALDIQSTETNAFSQDDVEIFSILADQVSLAIQNARLLEQAQRALHEAEVASRQLTGQAWRTYTEKTRAKGYRYDGIKPEAMKISGSDGEKNTLSLPVRLRGQMIGRLKLRTPDVNRKWTEDERAILESTAERVAIALESARLLEEAQRRASRESFLSDVGARLGASFQLDSILRDTVEELGKKLTGSTISFQLVNPSDPSHESLKTNTDSASRRNGDE